MRRAAACIVLAALTVATVPADAARLKLRKPARGFQGRITDFTVPAGGEREVCEFRQLPNKKPIDVQGFDLNLTPGSHHFVVWQYMGSQTDPAAFPTEPRDAPGCVGFGPQDSFFAQANLFGMQTSRARLRFPPGIAVRLEPHAFIYLNTHIRNFSDTEPLTAQAVFNFHKAKKGTVKHHAQAFAIGNLLDIAVPPRGSQSLTSEWRTATALNVVQISSHQHKRGTRTAIHRIDAAGNDLGQVFEGINWEHPGEKWFTEPLRIEPGEGLRFTCEWANADDHTVRFGVTTEDEMCFATGYFYLDDDLGKATGPGCLPQGSGLLCFAPKVQ